MQKQTHEIYTFDEFQLDLTRASLYRGAQELKLRPKSFDVLKYFAQNSGRLISKDELIDAVWHETAVTDDSLVQCLKDIRNALDDSSQSIIRTVPRRGYIFEKEVSENGRAFYSEETSVHFVVEETEDLPQQSKPARLFAVMQRHKMATALMISAIILTAVGAAFGIFIFLRRPAGPPFSLVSPRRLTTEGNAKTAAVSPDGNFVAYVVTDGGSESLWVRQVVAPNGTQIIPPAKADYAGLTFSPDGNFVNYVESGVLSKVPTLGGMARKLWEGVNCKVAFSPDGKRIAFVRTGDGKGSRLMLANADGTGEPEVLAARDVSYGFGMDGCSWSPNGKTILCSANEGGAGFGTKYPLTVSVADGGQTVLTSRPWNYVGQLAWLTDGSGIIMAADSQLWYVSFPSGVPSPIYDDRNVYSEVSITADSGTFVTVQQSVQLSINEISTSDSAGRVTPITSRKVGTDGWEGLTTTPDNQIVYYSETDDQPEIWIMNAKGSERRQLTFDNQMKSHFTVSPDGREVAYGLVGQGIWKIGIDGNDNKQLVDDGMMPFYSADGKWILYSLPRDRWTLWKVPTAGGEPVRITNAPSIQATVSPDGELIAFVEIRPRFGTKKLKIIRWDSGDLVTEIDVRNLRTFFNLEWTRDGKAVSYNSIENGIEKIVNQPIDGGPSQVLIAANSDSESIGAFAWARDGKTLFFASGPTYGNVAMFSQQK